MTLQLQEPPRITEDSGIRMRQPVDPNSGPAFRVLCAMLVLICAGVVFKSYYDNIRKSKEAAAFAAKMKAEAENQAVVKESAEEQTKASSEATGTSEVAETDASLPATATDLSQSEQAIELEADGDLYPDLSTFVPETADTPNRTHSAESSSPIRQQTPQHDQMVTPGNFQYLGAFRPPHQDRNGKEFTFGGWAMAHRPNGAAAQEDSGLGSLFVLGHAQQQLVSEISIPQPVISKKKLLADLPVAKVIQPFGDVTGGLRKRLTGGDSEEFMIGGLKVVGNGLHWTMFKYYNVTMSDYPSHGMSSLQTQNPIVEGPWHLGPMNSGNPAWNSYKNAGYIIEVPEQSRGWVGGRRFLSGLQISTGLNIASNGPAMYAYNLPTTRVPPGSALKAQPLVYNDLSTPAKNFHPADRWSGGAWLTLGEKQAVIIVGRKATGTVHYGEARPQDCTTDKGYHGTPYESQILFYAPYSLAMAAQEKVSPKQNPPWYEWTSQTPGGGLNQYLFPMCACRTGGVAYDRANNRLYFAQVTSGTTHEEPYEALPIIHVFEIVE